ncbi:hypothetical protein, partial [Microvirga aerophila]|uniref:hypothetical protein n=1 Tax=Microvirga aerophila TaxID=670291 RepID=UPI0014795EF5
TVSHAAGARRQIRLHLESSLIKDLKRAAVDLETSASAIANEAVDAWLRARSLRRDDVHMGSQPEAGR